MDRNGYYYECVSDAASECGLNIEQHHLKYIAEAVAGAVENYSTAFHTPDSPLVSENARLKTELKREQTKDLCGQCKGQGSLTTPGPYHSSTSQCWACNGSGFIYRK